MIAALMSYIFVISMLVLAAGIASEAAFRFARKPLRFVWAGAMLLVLGLSLRTLVVRNVAPNATERNNGSPGVMESSKRIDATSVATAALSDKSTRVQTPATLQNSSPYVRQIESPSESSDVSKVFDWLKNHSAIPVASRSFLTRFDNWLLLAWLVSSVVALAIFAVSARRLARPRPPWPDGPSDDVSVCLSREFGPAVTGVFRYRIVLPAWVLTLTSKQRELVLAHEREHVLAGDPSLLFVASILLALMPWNVALWLMSRRLRFAIELDCDARVLRRFPDTASYATLLLDVSERTTGVALPIAALAESVSQIERRITAMSGKLPKFATLRLVGGTLAAVVLLGAAGMAPRPARAAGVPLTKGVWMQGATQTTYRSSLASDVKPDLPSQSASKSSAIPTTIAGATKAAPTVVATSTSALLSATDDDDALAGCDPRVSSHDSEHIQTVDGNDSWRLSARNANCSLEIKSEGQVSFNADATAVDRISPSAFFDASTTVRGVVTRLVVRGGEGGPQYEFTRNNQRVDFANGGATWFAQFLLAVDRVSAFAIDRRFPQLMATGGTNAVFGELAHMHSGRATVLYLQRMIDSTQLDGVAIARIGAFLSPSSDWRLPEHEVSDAIVALTGKYAITNMETRNVYLNRILVMDVDHERNRSLLSLLEKTTLTDQESVKVLKAATSMHVDHEIFTILSALAPAAERSADVRSAYVAASDNIRDARVRFRALSILRTQ